MSYFFPIHYGAHWGIFKRNCLHLCIIKLLTIFGDLLQIQLSAHGI